MKNIILGINDYLKDIAHDKALVRYFGYCSDIKIQDYNDFSDVWHRPTTWKEGSVWHYIRQRRIASKKPKVKEWHFTDFIKNKGEWIQLAVTTTEEFGGKNIEKEILVRAYRELGDFAKKKGWAK